MPPVPPSLLLFLFLTSATPPSISGEIEVTTPALEATANATDPAVATDGADFLLVWRSPARGTFWLSAARVSHEGQLLDPAGFSVSGAARDAAWMAPPEVQFVDGRYLVTQPGLDSLAVIALDRGGNAIAHNTIAATFTGVQHRAAANADRMLVAWDGGRGVIVDSGANVVAQVQYSGAKIETIVASSSSEFLVFSSKQCAGAECPQVIVVDRVSSDGRTLSTRTVLDPTTLPNGATSIDAVTATRAGAHRALRPRPQADARRLLGRLRDRSAARRHRPTHRIDGRTRCGADGASHARERGPRWSRGAAARSE